MKLFLAGVVLLATATVRAQYLPATPTEDAMEGRLFNQAVAPATQELLTLQQPKPNELKLKVNGVTYSGSIVEIVKTRQPLQMINPFASAEEFGTTQDNTVIDPVSGRGTGLKLLSIQF